MQSLLSVLQSRKGRGLLLTGDNSMGLMSLRSGKVLAEAASFGSTDCGRWPMSVATGHLISSYNHTKRRRHLGVSCRVTEWLIHSLSHYCQTLAHGNCTLVLLRNKFGQKGDK
jgi:hypothetical protein